MDQSALRVGSLMRYPVKSMGGERLDWLELGARGALGDRLWATYTEDGGIGSGKRTRRFRKVQGLLDLAARTADDGTPVVLFPDGEALRADQPQCELRVSEYVGQKLRLATEDEVSHHDDSPLHLVSTSSLAYLSHLLGEAVDLRRFRPNLVLESGDAGSSEGFLEDTWLGREVSIGEARLLVTAHMPRCVMTDMAQPTEGLPRHGHVLKTLGSHHEANFGVMVEVVVPGKVRVGDLVTVH